MNHGTKSYEIKYEDGTNEVISEVTGYTVDNNRISFTGADGRTGGNYLIKSVHVGDVKSFGVVTDPEKLTTPKYVFEITLQDNSVKVVKADLYRVASVNDNAVYEFFTQLAGDFAGASREEFTIPFASVKFVERVDPAQAATTASAPVNSVPVDETLVK
jgi:hypothetical protein